MWSEQLVLEKVAHEVAHEAQPIVSLLFLLHFYIACDLLYGNIAYN